MRIKYCRKIYSSWLRQSGGIEPEIIDMLSGRVGKNIFLRHYYTPSLNYRAKVLDSIQELHKALDV
jgi:intergrase/recombinase